MYYHTENERYYKISNRKSVRVSKEEGENNINQLNQLTKGELKKLLPENKEETKPNLLKLLLQKIKKDTVFEKKVKNVLVNSNEEKINSRGTTKPSKGDIVRIILKPYNEGVTKVGIVKDVLTKKEVHTRGHKVRLHNEIIGRLVKIIRKKTNIRKE